MNQDYNGYTKRKLIEMAKNQGISTSGAKQDIIDRLKNYDAKSRPTPSKKITQEEYDRQVAILNEEMELEEMERAMKKAATPQKASIRCSTGRRRGLRSRNQ